MPTINSQFIERYQEIFQKDPGSKIFAPLAEAYRKMGLLKEACEICEKGIQTHPNFPSGRVAYGRTLLDSNKLEDAIKQLRVATQLSPDNILAHRLLADTLLKLREPKEALASYKMVLFLNPEDPRALQAIGRLESLTADEYDASLFQMEAISKDFISEQESKSNPIDGSQERTRHMERLLSLADAFIVRNDLAKARQTLSKAKTDIGSHPEIDKRLEILASKAHEKTQPVTAVLNDSRIKKINFLKEIYARVDLNRRRDASQ